MYVSRVTLEEWQVIEVLKVEDHFCI